MLVNSLAYIPSLIIFVCLAYVCSNFDIFLIYLLKMSLIGNVGSYNEAEEEFESYVSRVELFFDASSIAEDKKVPSFLTLIGPKTFSLVKDLVSPAKPGECTYKTLVDSLKAHYKPQVVVIFERFKFYSKNQEPNECI